jgi:D-alanyl-D-alanine carboxypeptidase/D-alanyl-D-alanine-endopeptidase (penicillin-binding protein 4)
VLQAAASASDLQHLLAGILAPTEGCFTVDGSAGQAASLERNRPLAGASTQKLLVAAAAIGVLGSRHRFVTRATTSAPLHAGTLDGDLVIVGGGDPMLTTSSAPSTAAAPNTSLAELADEIVKAGVRRINGALVADDTRYDRARAVPDWKAVYVAEGDVGALGALIVNGGRGKSGIAAADPALDVVQQLATLLAARGVRIANGAIDPGRSARSGRELARVTSPPLGEIVEQMLTVSNDETAELLTRELGVDRAHAGSTLAGARVIPTVLAALGVPVSGVILHDGSGLAPDNRITCASLSGVVALGMQPKYSAILDGLPIAAQSGTLFGRFGGTALAGKLRAKTGHIDGVVGLAGIIEAANAPKHPPGDPANIRFSFLANSDFSTSAGETLQDRVAEAIGGYLDAPAAPNLVPAPR